MGERCKFIPNLVYWETRLVGFCRRIYVGDISMKHEIEIYLSFQGKLTPSFQDSRYFITFISSADLHLRLFLYWKLFILFRINFVMVAMIAWIRFSRGKVPRKLYISKF